MELAGLHVNKFPSSLKLRWDKSGFVKTTPGQVAEERPVFAEKKLHPGTPVFAEKKLRHGTAGKAGRFFVKCRASLDSHWPAAHPQALGVERRMGTRIRGATIKSVSLLLVLVCVCSCSDKKIEERLKSLSGNEYLKLSQEEKSDIVKKSLHRYTTWKFWDRPDLCDYVLNEKSLTSLYQKAAENAKENLMVYSFVVYANEECIKQGQFSK